MPCIPGRVVNRSRESIFGSRPVSLATVVPAWVARRHLRRCRLRRSLLVPSTFPSLRSGQALRSLRSRPITALPRYDGRSDSCPSGPGALPSGLGTGSFSGQVSLIHALGLPTIPSPPAGASPVRLRTPSRPRPGRPRSFSEAGLRSSSAGSPFRVSRIEFVILRTRRSPPAALHPVLRRRSCRRVTVWRWLVLERTFTSLTKCAFRRTDSSLRSE